MTAPDPHHTEGPQHQPGAFSMPEGDAMTPLTIREHATVWALAAALFLILPLIDMLTVPA